MSNNNILAEKSVVLNINYTPKMEAANVSQLWRKKGIYDPELKMLSNTQDSTMDNNKVLHNIFFSKISPTEYVLIKNDYINPKKPKDKYTPHCEGSGLVGGAIEQDGVIHIAIHCPRMQIDEFYGVLGSELTSKSNNKYRKITKMDKFDSATIDKIKNAIITWRENIFEQGLESKTTDGQRNFMLDDFEMECGFIKNEQKPSAIAEASAGAQGGTEINIGNTDKLDQGEEVVISDESKNEHAENDMPF